MSQDQLLLLMQSPTAQATLMQLQANNAATQATVATQAGGSALRSPNADSSLFLYPDTALAVPALMAKLDSLDSLVHADSIPRRYERRIFQGEQSSLFSSTTSMVGGDYPLKGGDALSITIFGGVEKQIETTIGPDGFATIEMAGRVSLSGKTLEAATAAIKQALGRSISGLNSGSSQISVTLASLSPVKVFVLGEVEVPGGYVFHGNTNVLLALYLARGPSPIGSVRRMQLVRDGKSSEVDLYEYLFRGNMADSGGVLHDGDVIVLPRAEALVEVQGDVGREAVYELKEGEGMHELLFYASGLNPTAADQSVVVERLLEGGRRDYLTIEPARTYVDSASAPYPLQDGDVVHVP
ncbi:MAG: SLBB domain-containing protein, partial [Fibrobacterales bacterium]|nr:SLBB domain-containing protein [Fibrobacterales bacterium]